MRRVGLCSGAAGDLLEAAAAERCDLYLTGELSERAAELARGLQLTLVAAGLTPPRSSVLAARRRAAMHDAASLSATSSACPRRS
ncbi:MAG: Nif3-like dinuclear metal center hexameric protein [Kofleriaceae bacterium]|nr:Nif3-like dinuclear metal center hexameric protein [Kofleriaceae bacterium]